MTTTPAYPPNDGPSAPTGVIKVAFTDKGVSGTKRTLITSAQLLDIITNPVEIIPAPGLGKVAVPKTVVCRFLPKTTPYTLGNIDNIFAPTWSDKVIDVGPTFLCQGLMDQVEAETLINDFIFQGGGLPGGLNDATILNSPVFLVLQGTTPGLTLGDGELLIVALWEELDFSYTV